MKFESKFKKIHESFIDLYQTYYSEDDSNKSLAKIKEGDTVNVLMLSDKGMRDSEKSDTARDYIVTKANEDGNKLELAPKQPIKQLNIETGAMEDYLGDTIKIDLSKEKGKLIATTNPGVWMLELTVDSKPLFKKEEDAIEKIKSKK